MSEDPKAEAMSLFEQHQALPREQLLNQLLDMYSKDHARDIAAHMLVSWSILNHGGWHHKTIAEYGRFMIDKAHKNSERKNDFPLESIEAALAAAQEHPNAETLYQFISQLTYEELEVIGI